MKNAYEIRGDITEIIINSTKHGRKKVLISTSKLELMHSFGGTWFVQWKECCKTFYVSGSINRDGKWTTINLHRWITGAAGGLVVDHIDHNGLNNKDDNLRVCSYSQNNQNRKSAPRQSKTGIRGVCWSTKSNKWRAQIMVNKKQIYLGLFTDINDAESAAKEARSMHMPFSKDAAITC